MVRIMGLTSEEGDRLILQTILQNAGFSVDLAAHGRIGLDLAKKHEYELVITDIFMPDIEGFDVIAELKHNIPKIKIIAISVCGLVGDSTILDMAESLGADDVMIKPIDGKWLVQRINALLGIV